MKNEFDLASLNRSTVGFDRVFTRLNGSHRATAVDSWPPYDIVKSGDDAYTVTLAVAGFGEEELSITHERNVLLVTGTKGDAETSQYLHRGIAGRGFERRFELADHVKVEGADLKNGLLSISLKREVPEEAKPRRIAIGNISAHSAPLHVEAERQAA